MSSGTGMKAEAPRGGGSGQVDDHTLDRQELVDEILWLERRIGSLSTMYSMATADRLGMNLVDMLGLGILAGAGPLTHGELAELVGLSGGAVTGLVDRLERLGLVRRERDSNDRRRVLLHVDLERAGDIARVFEPMQEASRRSVERFSDEELGIIARYNARVVELMQQATREMRRGPRVRVGRSPGEADARD